jgi:hypothetical protein
MTTTNVNYKESVAALAATEADIEARRSSRLQAAQRETQAANDDAAAEIAEARAEHAKVHDEADARLGADVQLRLRERLARMGGPDARAVAASIAESWRAFDERSRTELGDGLDARHLTLALAFVHNVFGCYGDAEAWGRGSTNTALDATDAALRAISVRAPDVLIESLLSTATVEVCRHVHTRGITADAVRAAALCSRATDAGGRRAAFAIDEERREKERERVAAAGREHQRWWSRVQSAILGGNDREADRARDDFNEFQRSRQALGM